jgi:hypothetical protein
MVVTEKTHEVLTWPVAGAKPKIWEYTPEQLLKIQELRSVSHIERERGYLISNVFTTGLSVRRDAFTSHHGSILPQRTKVAAGRRRMHSEVYPSKQVEA